MDKISLGKIAEILDGEFLGRNEDKIKNITSVSIDSRKELNGALFVALVGERVDGHDFLDSAFENGAVAALTQKDISVGMPIIKVKSTEEALKKLASYYKQTLPVKTVCVTGSVGKTSTKDLIYSVLCQKYKTLKTEGNYNNHIGLPLTIFNLDKSYEYAVLEMGMNHFGEIRELSKIAEPDVCVISNIGVSHIEFLGSRDGILKAKSEIFEYMNVDAKIILNGDCDKLITLKNKYPEAYFYGLSEDNHVYAKNIVTKDTQTHFTICFENKEYEAVIPLIGKHMVLNALSAFLIGFFEKISFKSILEGLKNAKLSKMRMEISKSEKGIKILNDAYNASPQSTYAAIDVLKDQEGVKGAILGDMFELGSFSKTLHEEVGAYVSKSDVDVIVFVGEMSKNGFLEAKKLKQNVYHFETVESCNKSINNIIKDCNVVLIKASRAMGFEKIANNIN